MERLLTQLRVTGEVGQLAQLIEGVLGRLFKQLSASKDLTAGRQKAAEIGVAETEAETAATETPGAAETEAKTAATETPGH